MNFKKRVNGSWTDIPHYIHNTSTDTLTTLPAVLYPNDTTATVGLKGNMSQSGTPSPTTPIQPQECGERTGNLLNPNGTWSPPSGQTAEVTVSGNSITITGKYYAYTSIPVTANGNYTAKYSATGNRVYVVAYRAQPFTTANMITSLSSSGTTINVGNTDTVWLLFYSGDGTTGTTTYSNFIFNEGSTPLDFEPYGYKIPISSANTTTPVYLGEVQSERNIQKIVFDGTENVSYNARNDTREMWVVTVPVSNGTTTPENVISSHYNTVNSTTKPLSEGGVCMRSTGVDVIIGGTYSSLGITSPSDSSTIVNAFKAYLAQQYANGTPVTVWYVLATPQTAIVNEPLRKIGEYADSVSGITIPTITEADTLSVGTTLQPSEVTVNYHGWHPVQSVHEADNGAWD